MVAGTPHSDDNGPMSQPTNSASAVIVGAGIVGNSLAYHLARLGWRDLVLVDKGPMPNPGGSTGHASNFIFPVDYSKMMTDLTADSSAQYIELGVFTESGGIEVARTAARSQELRRRASAAKAWGFPCELLSPAGVAKLVPYLSPEAILEGLYLPSVGVVDSLRAGTIMRERAQEMGALQVRASTEVTGIELSADGTRVKAVQTTAGDIDTDLVVICGGVWSLRLARMAGASLPLTPVVHQMISVGPIPLFADTVGEIAYPIVRDMDTNMYERQHGGDMEVGSYAHRPIVVPPDDIPSIEQSALSPTELPFTQDDFDPQLQDALELMPEILGDEKVGIRYAINGLISMTPDGFPLLGETPEVKGLWSVAASWIKEGPGIGRAVAEWMSGSTPEIDIHEADIARFYDHQRTREHVAARAREAFNKMYGIVHPAEQWESERPTRLSPVYGKERELGAVFFRGMGEAVLVRVQRAAARALRATPHGAPIRMGVALVVADHQRRTPRHARQLRAGRPVGLRRAGGHRPLSAGRPPATRRRPDERPGGTRRVHVLSRRARRVQGRLAPTTTSPTAALGSGPAARSISAG